MYMSFSGEEAFVRMILVGYFFILIAAFLVKIVMYVLKSIGMYRIGKHKGMENPWLAWIPFVRTYYQGSLAGAVSIGKHTVKMPGLWLLLIPLINEFAIGIFLVFMMMLVAGGMYAGGSFFRIFSGAVFVIVLLLSLCALICGLLVKLLKVFVDLYIFKELTSDSMALVHAVASALVPVYEDLCFFILREKGSKGMPPAGGDGYGSGYPRPETVYPGPAAAVEAPAAVEGPAVVAEAPVAVEAPAVVAEAPAVTEAPVATEAPAAEALAEPEKEE